MLKTKKYSEYNDKVSETTSDQLMLLSVKLLQISLFSNVSTHQGPMLTFNKKELFSL